MQHKKNIPDTKKTDLSPACLKGLLKTIGNLSRSAMDAGNNGDFDEAFFNMEDALSLSRDLNKKCLEAKLLNNLGLLYAMDGAWDTALLMYEESLAIVTDHYGTHNFLHKTLQKNIGYLLNPNSATAQ